MPHDTSGSMPHTESGDAPYNEATNPVVSESDEERLNRQLNPKRPIKKRKRLFTVLGVVAVVVLGAGIGLFVWHEQPGFCNTICHSPMDPYVEGYYAEDAQVLAAAHRTSDVACLSCHEPSIEEQVGELQKWLAGDFRDPLVKRNYDNAFCMDAECHPSVEDLSAATADLSFNPHDWSFHEVSNCNGCHSAHGQSTLVCTNCHEDSEGLARELGWKSKKA